MHRRPRCFPPIHVHVGLTCTRVKGLSMRCKRVFGKRCRAMQEIEFPFYCRSISSNTGRQSIDCVAGGEAGAVSPDGRRQPPVMKRVINDWPCFEESRTHFTLSCIVVSRIVLNICEINLTSTNFLLQ